MTATPPTAASGIGNRENGMPRHHPSDALLVGYGAGSLREGVSLVVTLHLLGCPDCRAALAVAEAVGGAMLEDLPPARLERVSLSGTLARLDDPPPPSGPPSRSWTRPWARRATPGDPFVGGPSVGGPSVPGPLRPYVRSLAAAPWQRLAPGLRRIELLPRTPDGGWVQLLRIAPGTMLPHHGHGGLEVTAVLSGSFTDEWGRYRAGDVAELDADLKHQPIADGHQECLCVIAAEAPLRFTGWMGRLIQPFIGF